MESTKTKYGTVVHWNPRGFGFLYSRDVNRRVFFHASEFNRETDPTPAELNLLVVSFEFAPARKSGTPDIAINVSPVPVPVAGLDALKSSEPAVAQ